MLARSLAILTVTLALLSPDLTSFAADEGWTPLFDGKTLDGWKVNGGFARYAGEDWTIVGTTTQR